MVDFALVDFHTLKHNLHNETLETKVQSIYRGAIFSQRAKVHV
jgi:hypothetical protein